MPTVTYLLQIRYPADPDLATVVEIEDACDTDDLDETFSGKVERWLGGKINHAEDALNDQLPDGWNVTIEAV